MGKFINHTISLSIFLIAILFSACTTPTEKLDPEANHVTILRNVTLTELEKLKKIGSGRCEVGLNAYTATANQLSCENYLRNEAAKKNANFIVITNSSARGVSSAEVEADFYRNK
ncbi:MAG: hypothetical protein WCK43_02470 [bacterium]